MPMKPVIFETTRQNKQNQRETPNNFLHAKLIVYFLKLKNLITK